MWPVVLTFHKESAILRGGWAGSCVWMVWTGLEVPKEDLREVLDYILTHNWNQLLTQNLNQILTHNWNQILPQHWNQELRRHIDVRGPVSMQCPLPSLVCAQSRFTFKVAHGEARLGTPKCVNTLPAEAVTHHILSLHALMFWLQMCDVLLF